MRTDTHPNYSLKYNFQHRLRDFKPVNTDLTPTIFQAVLVQGGTDTKTHNPISRGFGMPWPPNVTPNLHNGIKLLLHCPAQKLQVPHSHLNIHSPHLECSGGAAPDHTGHTYMMPLSDGDTCSITESSTVQIPLGDQTIGLHHSLILPTKAVM